MICEKTCHKETKTCQRQVNSCLFLLAVTICHISTASHVMVDTEFGKLVGLRRRFSLGIEAAVTDTVDEFLGIPYAAPPIGNRRFKPPEKASKWSGVRQATTVGATCPQASVFDEASEKLQDEDCLFLNIFSPYEESANKLYPVMFFIHGGSYLYGTGNRYNGTALALHGVVLVSINYRLGALGFLTSGNSMVRGNFGLLDQIMALKWVQANIHLFRGDPNKVTIFGSSAGGASVGLLILSPMAQNLFHHAIAQSGTANAMWASHNEDTKISEGHQSDFKVLSQGFGCHSQDTDRLMQCLRDVPWKLFRLNHVCQILSCTEIDPKFKPCIDKIVLHQSPLELLKNQEFPSLQYMTGTVRDEFGEFYNENFTKEQLYAEVDNYIKQQFGHVPAIPKAISHEYTNWSDPDIRLSLDEDSLWSRYYDRAQVLSDLGLIAPTDAMAHYLAKKKGMKVYLYHIDNNVSYHSVELNHVFGIPFIGGGVDEMGILTNFSEDDKLQSLMLMTIWTNFAKFGEPTPVKKEFGFKWDVTLPNKMNYIYFRGTTFQKRSQLRAQKVAIWNKLLPSLLQLAPTSHQTILCLTDIKTWIFFSFAMILLVVVVILLFLIIRGKKNVSHHQLLIRGNSNVSSSVNL